MNTHQIDHQDADKSENREHKFVVVKVRYPAASKPFIDPQASLTETIGQLQKRVMDAFEVLDTSNPDGSTTQYSLYSGDAKLDNASQTLVEIAEHHHEISLKLVQLVHQG